MTNVHQSEHESLHHLHFGEQVSGVSSQTHKLTTYECDFETLNYYAIFRFYVNRFGRLSATDPSASSILDQQSLDRYVYVFNDPTNLVDPFGLWPDEPQDPGFRIRVDVFALAGGGESGTLTPVPGQCVNVYLDGILLERICYTRNAQRAVGGGGSSGTNQPPSTLETIKRVNQCAGQLSQSFTLNPWPGNFFADSLLGNTWGTVNQAALGPGRGRAAGQLILDNPVPSASLTAAAQATVAAIRTGETTWSIGIPISHMPNTYNPVTVSTTEVTVGTTSWGRSILSGVQLFMAGKWVFDAGVYLGALYVCSKDPGSE